MVLEFSKIGNVSDGPMPQMGPTRTKDIRIEVGTDQHPVREVLILSQDAALELVAKLTPLLKARGCL